MIRNRYSKSEDMPSENSSSVFLPAVVMAALASTAVTYFSISKYNASKVDSLTKELEKRQRAFNAERKARTSLEKELTQNLKKEFDEDKGELRALPIGFLESCFSDCVGTPRQGQLAPSTRAKLVISGKHISPETLDGLEDFSHVWITFIFHLNSTGKLVRQFKQGVLDPKEPKKSITLPAKITPPRLKQKKGIFATRTPHRPNPIGITMARIERVSKSEKCLYLSGVDLVDGTPVLDIKPYVPFYDTADEPVYVPDWINETIVIRRNVIFEDPEYARSKMEEYAPNLKLYKDDPLALEKAITEVLAIDVRSKISTKKVQENGWNQLIEKVIFRYKLDDNGYVVITNVCLDDGLNKRSEFKSDDIEENDETMVNEVEDEKS